MNVPTLTDVVTIAGNMTFTPVRRETGLYGEPGPDRAAAEMYSQAIRMVKDLVAADVIATTTGLPKEAVQVYQRMFLQPHDAWWCGLDRARQVQLWDDRLLLIKEAFRGGVLAQLDHTGDVPQPDDVGPSDVTDVSGSMHEITIIGDLPSAHFGNPWEASGFR